MKNGVAKGVTSNPHDTRLKVVGFQSLKQSIVLFDTHGTYNLLHFVAFFHVVSQLYIGIDDKILGVDNEKALELDNRTFFSYFSVISI